MATMTVTFEKLHQDSQDYGSDEEHMISRAFCDISFQGKTLSECTVDLKQTVGSDFEKDPLEVSNLRGYEGPIDSSEMRNCAESYFRLAVGRYGTVFRIEGGSNVRMRDNWIHMQETYTFEVDPHAQVAGW